MASFFRLLRRTTTGTAACIHTAAGRYQASSFPEIRSLKLEEAQKMFDMPARAIKELGENGYWANPFQRTGPSDPVSAVGDDENVLLRVLVPGVSGSGSKIKVWLQKETNEVFFEATGELEAEGDEVTRYEGSVVLQEFDDFEIGRIGYVAVVHGVLCVVLERKK